jgi:hypothetical protein
LYDEAIEHAYKHPDNYEWYEPDNQLLHDRYKGYILVIVPVSIKSLSLVCPHITRVPVITIAIVVHTPPRIYRYTIVIPISECLIIAIWLHVMIPMVTIPLIIVIVPWSPGEAIGRYLESYARCYSRYCAPLPPRSCWDEYISPSTTSSIIWSSRILYHRTESAIYTTICSTSTSADTISLGYSVDSIDSPQARESYDSDSCDWDEDGSESRELHRVGVMVSILSPEDLDICDIAYHILGIFFVC